MEGLGSLLFFAIFFYIMMRYGCGAHMMHGHGGHGNHKKGKHFDPVCHKEIETNKGYGKMYGDTLYRFCSRNCLDKFDADPERYLNEKGGDAHEM